MTDQAQTDLATLRKLVTLHPAPVAATWSVAPIGVGGDFGPTDTTLWAVLRYSDGDFATIERALKADDALPPVKVSTPPAWLLAAVDLAGFRHGTDYVFDGALSAGRPFASDLYANGFALLLPDHRVLIQFSSR